MLPRVAQIFRTPFPSRGSGEAAEAVDELADGEVRRADSGYRRDDAAQDVVYSPILAGILDAHDIPDILHHAYGAVVTVAVRADGAKPVVGDHHALGAVLHFVGQAVDGVREMVDVLLRLAQQMHCQAQGAARTHAGQRTDRLDCILEEFRRILFDHRL